jgi:DNA mismatch endonuclease, patch repair protein
VLSRTLSSSNSSNKVEGPNLPRFKPPSTARSKNMRAIQSRGNATTERKLRAMLIRRAISGWKMHIKVLPGIPDFAFQDLRLAVFVDGCFWHGCPKCGHIPKTNSRYWRIKISRNMQRDRETAKRMKRIGYSILRFWECDLRSDPEKCLGLLSRRIARSNG